MVKGLLKPNITYCVTQTWRSLFRISASLKKHVIKYCEKVYERSGKNLFWSIKNSGEILDKLKARNFNATSLSTYDFSTLYTTLPHNLIKDKLIDLIERTFQREGSPYLACSDRNAFFTCICQFIMVLFPPKFMINVTTLNLKLSISHF